MDREMWIMFFVTVLIAALLGLCVTLTGRYIEQVGMKNIAHRYWVGVEQ
jgi:hypothetical protein